jgi:hypothetical protein
MGRRREIIQPRLDLPFDLLDCLRFSLKELPFSKATLPAVLPIANEELETKTVNFHARLKADAEVAVIHLILVDV